MYMYFLPHYLHFYGFLSEKRILRQGGDICQFKVMTSVMNIIQNCISGLDKS